MKYFNSGDGDYSENMSNGVFIMMVKGFIKISQWCKTECHTNWTFFNEGNCKNVNEKQTECKNNDEECEIVNLTYKKMK